MLGQFVGGFGFRFSGQICLVQSFWLPKSRKFTTILARYQPISHICFTKLMVATRFPTNLLQNLPKFNLWTQMGLVNGASGVVKDIIFDENEKNPHTILIEFDNYKGPRFFNQDDYKAQLLFELIPIFVLVDFLHLN